MKAIALTLSLLLGAMNVAQAEEKITVETDSPNVEIDIKGDGSEAPVMPIKDSKTEGHAK